jgi:hypothetical protein
MCPGYGLLLYQVPRQLIQQAASNLYTTILPPGQLGEAYAGGPLGMCNQGRARQPLVL